MSNFYDTVQEPKFKIDDEVMYNGQECIVTDVYHLPGNKEQPYQYETNCGPKHGLKFDKYGTFIRRIGGRMSGRIGGRMGRKEKRKSRKVLKKGTRKGKRTRKNKTKKHYRK